MAVTIILDAGHGGYDNGASYQGRKEKDDTLEVTLAVGQKLQEAGYDVLYTRTEDRYDSPYEKAQIANRFGADYFISLHRNSGEEPNTYKGTQALVYAADTEAARLGKAINDRLAEMGFFDLGLEERPGLVVLRRTRMPAVLMELGFINHEEDNERFSAQFDEMTDAIVEGVKSAIPLDGEEGARFGVQAGLFRDEANAAYLQEQLEDALGLQSQLRWDGYDTLVVSL